MKIEQWQKKPVRIQAVLLTKENIKDVANWCGGLAETIIIETEINDATYQLSIPTLEGVMLGKVGDYIIKGVRGEFYACRGDIFIDTYVKVGLR